MIDLTLQSEYLALLGITEWEKRQAHSGFMVMIDEPGVATFDKLDSQKQQLLTKMLAALHWPLQETQLFFEPKVEEGASLQFAKGEKKIVLPSLTVLLKDRAAKRQAWQLMQSVFIDG